MAAWPLFSSGDVGGSVCDPAGTAPDAALSCLNSQHVRDNKGTTNHENNRPPSQQQGCRRAREKPKDQNETTQERTTNTRDPTQAHPAACTEPETRFQRRDNRRRVQGVWRVCLVPKRLRTVACCESKKTVGLVSPGVESPQTTLHPSPSPAIALLTPQACTCDKKRYSALSNARLKSTSRSLTYCTQTRQAIPNSR